MQQEEQGRPKRDLGLMWEQGTRFIILWNQHASNTWTFEVLA